MAEIRTLPKPPRQIARRMATSSESFGADEFLLGQVRPTSPEDVQAIVRWAGEQSVPIVPVSSAAGRRRRCDTDLLQPSLVMDLSAMTRIHHVAYDERIALIDPGVTFDDLDLVLRPQKLRAHRPLLPRRGKSVIGAGLERESILCPYAHWDAPDPLASMEIVFGNGDRFRTGGAATVGSIDENWARGNRFMVDIGPSATDFGRVMQGAQGTFGVVTWASVHLEWIPARTRPFFVASSDLASLSRFVAKWCWRRLQGPMFIVSGAQLAGMTGRPVTAPWVAFGALGAPDYRPDERMAYEWAYVEADAAAQGLSAVAEIDTVSAADLHDTLFGPAAPCWKSAAWGEFDEVIVACQLDQCADLAAIAEGSPLTAGVYIQPQIQGVMCSMEITLKRPPSEPSEVRQRRLIELAGRLVDAGAHISRAYAPWGKVAFERDPGGVELLEQARELLDPQHILSPGRLCFDQAAGDPR